MRAAATALLVCTLAAPALTAPQQISPADRDLIMRFVSASPADRTAIMSAEPRVAEPPFLEVLANAGNLQRSNGNLDLAEAVYRSLLFIGESRQLPRTISVAYNNLGIVYGSRFDLPQATSFFERSMDIAEKEGDVKGLQSTWGNLGIIQRKLGELDLAESSIRRSLSIAEGLGEKALIAHGLNNLGLVYQDRGDSAAAQDFYLRSLKLKEEAGVGARDQSTTLTNLGTIFDEQGDYAQALFYYQRGYDLMTAAGIPDSGMIATLNNLGHVHTALHRNADARAFYMRGLAVSEKNGERGQGATILYNLGGLEQMEGKFAESEALQRRALAIREELGSRVGIVESLTGLAHLADNRGAAAEGLPYVERAVSLARESLLLNQLWKAQYTQGRLQTELGRTEDAAQSYADAIATIEKLRQSVAGGDAGRRGYLFERVGPYYGLATLKAKTGDAWSALAVMEQSRARALVDIVGSGHQPTRQLSEAQQQKERSLIQAVTAAAGAIETESQKSKPNLARLAALDADLTRARAARDAFTGELYAQQPDLKLARGNAGTVSREQIAALVKPGSAVVTFAYDVDGPWVYLIRGTAAGPVIRSKPLAIDQHALGDKADAFTQQVAKRDLGFAAAARELYGLLLGPLDADLAGVRDIVVIPDGPLWSVPFQALITPRGKFLLEEHPISYTPSLSALQALESRRASRTGRPAFLLALGDPALPGAPAGTATERGAAAGRLPEAAREVAAIGRLYGGSRSEVLTEGAASEQALRANLSRASVVHLATHGILDDRNPMYSRLLLSPGRAAAASGDHTSDGRLEAWEILDLGFTADLAVLSACQTARGKFGWGEGVVGLSWSLFAGGASTAVVSQWEVDSASTTRLMIAFHEQMLRGGSDRSAASAALRTASLAVMKQPAYRHPFYWAGFISVGAR
jgi:CHAT domain-containing protein/Tfp pilus assembly protein PilF